jgi:dihydroflavonol-4-reductase
MKVFVTGAAGFIGSHLTEKLLQKGYKITCLVRKSTNIRWINDLQVQIIYGDLLDSELLKSQIKDTDYVYHVAGVIASKKKEGYFLGNHISTRNLLEAARHNKNLKRFVLVGSQTAVGPSINGVPVEEETPYRPITTYGRSKMEAEKEVLKHKDKLPFTIVRLPAIYGPRDTATFDFFKSVNVGIIPMVGFKKKYVNILHVRDAAEGIILAGENPNSLNKIYHLGSEKSYTWDEISAVTMKVLHRKAVKIRLPEFLVMLMAGINGCVTSFYKKPAVLNWEKGKDMIADAWTCNITKAKKELGYTQKIGLEEGVKETIEWYKKEGWLK